MRKFSLVSIALLALSASADPVIYFRTVSCILKVPSSSENVVQNFDVLLNIEQFGSTPQDGLLAGEILAPQGSASKTLGMAIGASFINDSNLRISSDIAISQGFMYQLKIELTPPATSGSLSEGTATVSDGTNVVDYNCLGFME